MHPSRRYRPWWRMDKDSRPIGGYPSRPREREMWNRSCCLSNLVIVEGLLVLSNGAPDSDVSVRGVPVCHQDACQFNKSKVESGRRGGVVEVDPDAPKTSRWVGVTPPSPVFVWVWYVTLHTLFPTGPLSRSTLQTGFTYSRQTSFLPSSVLSFQ